MSKSFSKFYKSRSCHQRSKSTCLDGIYVIQYHWYYICARCVSSCSILGQFQIFIFYGIRNFGVFLYREQVTAAWNWPYFSVLTKLVSRCYEQRNNEAKKWEKGCANIDNLLFCFFFLIAPLVSQWNKLTFLTPLYNINFIIFNNYYIICLYLWLNMRD